MIIVDESDPIDELEPAFPFREVNTRRGVTIREAYEVLDEIGRGKFGRVYRCRDRETGLMLAAKVVSTKRKEERRNVEREIEIMKKLQHPRLIQLFDAIEDLSNSETCLVLEMVGGGELFDRVIQDEFVLTERACAVFVRQISEAVEYIHSQNILHLDMKPENVMCLSKNGNRIKIIDFGLARFYDPTKKLQVLFGTPEFVAPEVVNFEAIDYATDMWSIGVITYVLLSGLSPFMGESDVETMANVTIAKYDFDDECFEDISEDAKDFIAKLLVKDKKARLTASECLKHRWLLTRIPNSSPPNTPEPLNLLPTITSTAQTEPTSSSSFLINNDDQKIMTAYPSVSVSTTPTTTPALSSTTRPMTTAAAAFAASTFFQPNDDNVLTTATNQLHQIQILSPLSQDYCDGHGPGVVPIPKNPNLNNDTIETETETAEEEAEEDEEDEDEEEDCTAAEEADESPELMVNPSSRIGICSHHHNQTGDQSESESGYSGSGHSDDTRPNSALLPVCDTPPALGKHRPSLELTKEHLRDFVARWTDTPYLFDSPKGIITHLCSENESTTSDPVVAGSCNLHHHHNIPSHTHSQSNLSSGNSGNPSFECGVNIVNQIRRFSYQLHEELQLMKTQCNKSLRKCSWSEVSVNAQ